MAAEVQKAGQRVSVADLSPLPATIERASFDIVQANLLDNARQHAGSKASVTISGWREGGDVIVEVKDDGVGVSAGNTDRIFHRPNKGRRSTSVWKPLLDGLTFRWDAPLE